MIGLFGGTFDPFHNAHRALVKHAVLSLGLDQLVVMPVGRAPHKNRRTSFAAYRYEMACRGTKGLARVCVSDDEIKTPGVDYTYHTVQRLKAEGEGTLRYLVSGSDVLMSIDSWYRPEALLKEVDLAVAVRGGIDLELVKKRARAVEAQYGCRVTLFEMPKMELSATAIREALSNARHIEEDCPRGVTSFLQQYRPYEFTPVFESLDDEAWQQLLDAEEWAWTHQSQERRLHAASVAQYAGKLAALNGEDVRLAALGGLLHDVAKTMPENERDMLVDRYFARYPSERAGLGSCVNEALAHGPASAMLVWERSGVRDDRLSEAIAFHSTAAPDMSRLSELLFLADKIAYDRSFERLDDIRSLAETGSIAEAMRLCLREVLGALKRMNEAPCPLTLQALDYYNVI